MLRGGVGLVPSADLGIVCPEFSGTSLPFPEGVYSLLKAEQEFQAGWEAAPLRKGHF